MIVISAPQANWPELYRNEEVNLRRKFGDKLVAIHHVGSTSVADLDAKPIIDILIEVEDIRGVEGLLRDLGYIKFELALPLHEMAVRATESIEYKAMVFERDSPELKRLLGFRDYLRTHPKCVKAYAALKHQLAKKFANDRSGFTRGKNAFIQKLDQLAGFDLPRVVNISALAEGIKVEYNAIFGPAPQEVVAHGFVLIQALQPLASARILLSPLAATIELHSHNGSQQHLENLKKVMQRWLEVYAALPKGEVTIKKLAVKVKGA
jgi:GrpB-like predicted nucleotidyltransferase (UPF0157 family)